MNRQAIATADFVLREELNGRAVNPTLAVAAMLAAEELVEHRRSLWAVPADGWEELVVALAVTVLRLEGGAWSLPRQQAIDAVRHAAEAVARLRPAGWR